MTQQPGASFTDIAPVLKKIEEEIAGLAKPEQRLPMLTLYILFNTLRPLEARRPRLEQLLTRHETDLKFNSPEGMLLYTLGVLPDYVWTSKDLAEAWNSYTCQRHRKQGLTLGPLLDAAVLLTRAERCRVEGQIDEARQLVSASVEEWPGNRRLIELETALRGVNCGEISPIHWPSILLPQGEQSEQQTAVKSTDGWDEDSGYAPESQAVGFAAGLMVQSLSSASTRRHIFYKRKVVRRQK